MFLHILDHWFQKSRILIFVTVDYNIFTSSLGQNLKSKILNFSENFPKRKIFHF